MEKAYKAEFTLGLIGAIIGIIVFILTLVFGIFISFFGSFGIGYGGGALIAGSIIAVILSLASFILGFIGASKLNKNIKSGGIILIVAGGLSVICIFVGGWYALFSAALLLTGGIMAAVKKAPVA